MSSKTMRFQKQYQKYVTGRSHRHIQDYLLKNGVVVEKTAEKR